MNKSPINILQEILIKEGCLPKYSYGLDASDFKCEVTCKSLSAAGTGTSKREAKHNAAMNMLSMLNITMHTKEHKTGNKKQDLKIHQTMCDNNEPNNTNIFFPLKAQTFPEYNYIGVLQELCVQYRLNLPLYELIHQSGPSHMRTFHIKCNVGCYEMIGKANCKKAAKQEAAKNVLYLLLVLNILPKDVCKKIEKFEQKIYNDRKDVTVEKSNIEMNESILSAEISEITEVLGKALSTYVESTANNTKSPEDIQSNYIKSIELYQSNSDGIKQQNINENSHANLSSTLTIPDKGCKRTIEDELRAFDVEIIDTVDSNATSHLTELSRKTLSTYVASEASEDLERYKFTNATTSNIIDNDSAVFNNNNTIKNVHKSIYQTKSIETVNDYKQTLENNCKKLDVDKSIVESASTKPSESEQSNHVESNLDSPMSTVTRDSHINLSVLIDKNKEHKQTSASIEKDKENKQTIEDELRAFNIEIIDTVESNATSHLTDLSKKALSTYIASGASEEKIGPDLEKYKFINTCLTDAHNLFKKIYSDKISDDLKKKMYIVSKLSNHKSSAVQETYQDVQKALGVKLKQMNYSGKSDATIICLRMLSTPVITQFGIGPTENDAKAEAMFAIIKTILEYVK